jgi:mRNA interferase MazF
VKQGEIDRVNLDPVVGHEIGGENFVVVVSNNGINNTFLPVVVVPLTAAAGVLPPHVYGALVTAAESGLNLDVIAECLQVRAIDQSRFTGAPEGSLSHTAMKAVEKALHKVLQV